jgi:hypothetical protein
VTYLLDTNVLSEGMRAIPDANVAAWINSVDEDQTFISVVSLAELHRGIFLMANGRRRDALAHWVHIDLVRRFEQRIVGVTTEIAAAWGQMMARAKLDGFGLQIMDGFLAATAHVHAMTLVTRNIKDFSRLNIALHDPWRTPA